MPAVNQPKGSVSAGSIKPVTRKAVRCQREVAWLVTQAAGKLVATTDDVNAPTPSFVLAAALSFAHEQEQAAQDNVHAIDYDTVMSPALRAFVTPRGCPQHPTRFRTRATCSRSRARTSSATSTPTVVTWANAWETRCRSNQVTRSN